MSQAISILVGTMTGTAEMVADDVKPVLEASGYEVEILDMDGLGLDVFDRDAVFLICTSTYGQGDVPDNAMELFEALQTDRPDLSKLRYGVIGLGDSTYSDTYNHGGERFDTLLAELGGARIGERMAHNASSDELPEEMAVAWAEDWVKQLG